MKKYLLAAALVMASTSALAETTYCVAYGFGPAARTAVVYSVSDASRGETCSDTGCLNQWNDYMASEYKDSFKWQTGTLGPYKTESEAVRMFREQKANALDRNRSFHHATSFSCSL